MTAEWRWKKGGRKGEEKRRTTERIDGREGGRNE